MDSPLVLYPDIRSSLQSGDVVTFDGDGLVSRAIRYFSGVGTHTAMVFRSRDCPGVVFLLESLEHGPVITRMSRRISNYAGRIFVTRIPATAEQRDSISRLAMLINSARIAYDYPSLFANARRRVALSLSRGFCSETVQYIHTQAGVLHPELFAMTPHDFLQLGWPTLLLASYSLDSEASEGVAA